MINGDEAVLGFRFFSGGSWDLWESQERHASNLAPASVRQNP